MGLQGRILQRNNMSKNPINKQLIKDTVKVSQAIEGYNSSTNESIKKAQELMEKYEIKVSTKKQLKHLFYGNYNRETNEGLIIDLINQYENSKIASSLRIVHTESFYLLLNQLHLHLYK